MKLLSLALLLLSTSGCASNPKVTLSKPGQTFTRDFDQAYCSSTARGDDLIVLKSGVRGDGNKSGLVHVLRIRTLWHPVNGAKPDSPAATNAALRYFVTSPLDRSYVHYAGTGFVLVDHGGGRARVSVRRAQLICVDVHGSMSDPLHAFTLSGEFNAVEDGHQVDAILNDLAQTVPKNKVAPTTTPASKLELP